MKEEDQFNYDLINLTTSVIVGSLVSSTVSRIRR